MPEDVSKHGLGEADFDGYVDRDALTTNPGEAVSDNRNTRTAGPQAPALMDGYHYFENYHYFEKMAQFTRKGSWSGSSTQRVWCVRDVHGDER